MARSAGPRPARRRRRRWATALLVASAALAVFALWRSTSTHPATQSLTDRPRDVLLITIDTLRADAVGAYGNPTGATPWIDRLAAAGVRFDAAHAQNVVTLPSHANILSGRYPFAHGVRDNAGFRFPDSIDTLATLLHAHDYRTGAFVSAFPLDARFGLARGFDEYDDQLSVASRPAFLEQERPGAETVGRARAWLDRGDGRPAFCWVHLYEPHFPYAPPEPFATRFRDQPYEGDVAAADAALAPLLAPILGHGRTQKNAEERTNAEGRRPTLVVLTADHGESLGEHGEATHGIFGYESTLRVPLVIYGGDFTGGTVRHDPARHVDILPTILSLLDIPPPANIDGRSLDPRSSNLEPRSSNLAPRTSYFEALSGALNRGWAPVRGVVSGNLKYIDLPLPELYDLAADPAEQHNLIDARPEEARTLKTVVERFPIEPARRTAEDQSTREQLAALGYASTGPRMRASYSASDDPKELIGVDRELQAILDLYLAGNGRSALEQARTLAAQHPKMPIAWLEVGHLEREQGNLAAGIAALTRAHTLDKGSSQIAALLGGYLTQDGRPADAVALLDPYVGADADVDVLSTLALAQARLGKTETALALLRRAHAEDPRDAMLFVHEGTVQLMAGRSAEARAAFEQALARNPGLARAHSSLAAIDVDAGRPGDAVPHWRAAVAADPSELGRIFGLGVAQARSGRVAQARAYLSFFAEAAPPDRYAPQIAQARRWLAESQ
ncbi:MAG TPA: sulfatase-like hydrolase/transferase [Vicinamibacterales bacterium]|nr:sulfatase-like hydrolase/transferase [Vicinamibacterales bacterium]